MEVLRAATQRFELRYDQAALRELEVKGKLVEEDEEERQYDQET
jgi:hypothetical protein